MKALVTGISGQDGSHLAELLLAQGVEVHGIVRRHSVATHQTSRIGHLGENVRTHYGDVNDVGSIECVLHDVKPDYVFNLAAQSHVRVSFEVPHYTLLTNGIGAFNVFDACRRIVPDARVLQASSSEMFGLSIDADGYQRETTPMNPTSPYGCAKLLAYNLARHLRRAHGMHVSSSICFNHMSMVRSVAFVEQKICRGAVEIAKGKRSNLVLGNLDAKRDWGSAADYVRAMWLIVNRDEPDDFVIATGKSFSVRRIVEHVFGRLGLDMDRVQHDDKYERPEELPELRGDASKARDVLGWRPTVELESLLDGMIAHWMENL